MGDGGGWVTVNAPGGDISYEIDAVEHLKLTENHSHWPYDPRFCDGNALWPQNLTLPLCGNCPLIARQRWRVLRHR